MACARFEDRVRFVMEVIREIQSRKNGREGFPADREIAGHDYHNGPRHAKCTCRNKCLLHMIEHPLGCYDQSYFETGAFTHADHDRMFMDVFEIFSDYTEPSTPWTGGRKSAAACC